MVLLLIDSRYGVTEADQQVLQSLPVELPLLTVYNKIDLIGETAQIKEESGKPVVYLSARTGTGLELLRMKILEIIGWQSNIAGEGLFMARQRHLQALNKARAHLDNAVSSMECDGQLELLAEELRLAQLALSSITGEFTADDLLGEIFSRFCIGK